MTHRATCMQGFGTLLYQLTGIKNDSEGASRLSSTCMPGATRLGQAFGRRGASCSMMDDTLSRMRGPTYREFNYAPPAG